MDIKFVNEILADFRNIRSSWKNDKWTKVSEKVSKEIEGEGEQGEEGEATEVYQSKLYPSIYVKFELRTDSYGDNEHVIGVQFVKPIIKEVTDFEPIA